MANLLAKTNREKTKKRNRENEKLRDKRNAVYGMPSAIGVYRGEVLLWRCAREKIRRLLAEAPENQTYLRVPSIPSVAWTPYPSPLGRLRAFFRCGRLYRCFNRPHKNNRTL
ncbi:MAG: hypothetical protein ACRELG_30255, partial [Gemmataceae bacterium]